MVRRRGDLKKWIATSIICFSTGKWNYGPGLPAFATKYGITNSTVLALTLSIYFGIAPLIIAPLLEMYGRTWILHIGNLTLSVAGISGITPLAIGGRSVGDMFLGRDRAPAMALYTPGPLCGMGLR